MTPRIDKFQHNEVYAALTKTGIPGLLHWLIYVVDDVESGWMVHAASKNSKAFYFVKEEWRYVDDDTAVAFIKIGQIDEGQNVDHLVEYVKAIPMNVVPESQVDDESRFSCRVFVKEAVRLLDKAGAFVRCPDIQALAGEIQEKVIDIVQRQHSESLPLFLTSEVSCAWPISDCRK